MPLPCRSWAGILGPHPSVVADVAWVLAHLRLGACADSGLALAHHEVHVARDHLPAVDRGLAAPMPGPAQDLNIEAITTSPRPATAAILSAHALIQY